MIHYHTVPFVGKKAFENIVEKEENAGNQQFSPFSTMFSTLIQVKNHYMRYIDFVVCKISAFDLD